MDRYGRGKIMKFLGSKTIETDRLILKAQTMNEQKRLWEILIIPDVNKYFLTVPLKLRDKLRNWNKQKIFYEEEMKHAKEDNVFRWSIFLKDTKECIGKISCHEKHEEDKGIHDPNIRGVGWMIDPSFQKKGYGVEAAKAMVDFMFLECEIEQIITEAAICNPASWRIMEKLSFERQEKSKKIQYTFLDDLTECYSYVMTKERYLALNSSDKKK